MFLDSGQALVIRYNDEDNNHKIQEIECCTLEDELSALFYINPRAVKIYVATFDEGSLCDVTEDLAECFIQNVRDLVIHYSKNYPDWVKSSSAFSALELEGE